MHPAMLSTRNDVGMDAGMSAPRELQLPGLGLVRVSALTLVAVLEPICISMQCWHNGIRSGNLGAVEVWNWSRMLIYSGWSTIVLTYPKSDICFKLSFHLLPPCWIIHLEWSPSICGPDRDNIESTFQGCLSLIICASDNDIRLYSQD